MLLHIVYKNETSYYLQKENEADDPESPNVFLKVITDHLPKVHTDEIVELDPETSKKFTPILYKGECIIGFRIDKKVLNKIVSEQKSL